MKRAYSFFLLIFLLACSISTPTPMVVTATPASSQYPTITITPSPTVSLTPSIAPSPTLTPTPDLRIIAAPAQDFKLQLSDLPRGYTLVQDAVCRNVYDPQCQLDVDLIEGPDLNYEVLQELGTVKGGNYVNDTRRVEGWYAYYHYGYGYKDYPSVIMSSVIRFADAEGARKYMSAYAGISVVPYKEIIGYPQTGDAARAFARMFYGEKYLYYEFAYKNMVHRLWFYGTEENIAPNLIQDLSFKALLKFQAADLTFPTPIVPPFTLTPAADAPFPDSRAIDSKPLEIALAESDLPAEGRYRLSKPSYAAYGNDVLAQDYPQVGWDYVQATARVDGWRVGFKRGANDLLLPARIEDNLNVFADASGAQKHVNEYAADFLGEGWSEVAPESVIGDATRVFIKYDGVYAEYRLVFAYRNLAHELTAYGLQAEIDPAYVDLIAARLLVRLQSAPLAP